MFEFEAVYELFEESVLVLLIAEESEAVWFDSEVELIIDSVSLASLVSCIGEFLVFDLI